MSSTITTPVPRQGWQVRRGSWSPSSRTRTCRPGGRPGMCSAGTTPSPARPRIFWPRWLPARRPVPVLRTAWRCKRCWTRWCAAPPRRAPPSSSPEPAPGTTFQRQEQPMPRNFTLFTGQWADLPFEKVAELAAGWGYDGLEFEVYGDHLDAWRWDDDDYIADRLDILERHGLKVWAISNHLKGQAVCDDPIDFRH